MFMPPPAEVFMRDRGNIQSDGDVCVSVIDVCDSSAGFKYVEALGRIIIGGPYTHPQML